tara:strand:+ start:154 stop:309 length:156 start_codon:yes stop_codon:yes gene_type:complete
MRILLVLLGIAMTQISLIIALHTSHQVVSILLFFMSVMMIFEGLPNYGKEE